MRRRLFIKSLLTGVLAAAAPRAIAKTGVTGTTGAVGAAGGGRPRESDCIIVGAGISGLTAAYLLDDDHDILVLEAADKAGGRVQAGTWRGWRYAGGAEYLARPEGLFAEMIEYLKLRPVEIPYPMDVYNRDGRYWKGETGRVRLLVERGGIKAFNRFLMTLFEISLHYQTLPEYRPDGPLAELDRLTCRQWFEKLMLPPVYHDVYNVSIRGLFGASLDEISALGAFEELAFDFAGMKRLRSVRDLDAWEEEEKYEGATGTFSFPGGIADVTDALARDLGERCRLGARVRSIEGNDRDGYRVLADGPDGLERLAANSVILAVPAPAARKIAQPVLSPGQNALLGQVRFAPYVTVAVFSDKPIFDKGFDLAVPDGLVFTDIYDATWVQRRTAAAHGGGGYVSTFSVAPPGYGDHDILEQSDEAIVRACLKDLDTIIAGWNGRVLGADVRRFEHGYPVMTPGAYARLSRLHHSFPGLLQMAGDGMVYPNIEGAIIAGETAAERIMEKL